MTDQNHNPCQQVKDLAKRMDKVETWIQDVDKRGAITEVLLDKLEKAFNRVVDVVEGVDDTLIKMNAEIQNQSLKIESLSQTTSKLNEKFEESEKKFKVDFRDILKSFLDKNSHLFIPGAIVTGLGTGIFAFIKWIIENQATIVEFINNFK